MKVFKNIILIFVTLLLMGFLALLIYVRYPIDDPNTPPSTFATPVPLSDPLPPIKISVLETGYSTGPEGLINNRGPLFQTRKMVHPAILVAHPQATFLIDGGLSKNIQQEIAQVPWYGRLINFTAEKPAVDHSKIQKLEKKMDFILLTHGHWDHASGTLDFPRVAVRLLPEEIKFMSQIPNPYRNHIWPHQVKKLKDRWVPLALQEVPYENFSRSLDLFGDGSVVVVPLRGHTPGSLGIFLNQASDIRYFIVGDAIFGVDPEGRPKKKSRLMEWFSDYDRDQARAVRKKLAELMEYSNEITLIPIHDPKALQKIGAEQGQ